jgi:hypothetical protein
MQREFVVALPAQHQFIQALDFEMQAAQFGGSSIRVACHWVPIFAFVSQKQRQRFRITHDLPSSLQVWRVGS